MVRPYTCGGGMRTMAAVFADYLLRRARERRYTSSQGVEWGDGSIDFGVVAAQVFFIGKRYGSKLFG